MYAIRSYYVLVLEERAVGGRDLGMRLLRPGFLQHALGAARLALHAEQPGVPGDRRHQVRIELLRLAGT